MLGGQIRRGAAGVVAAAVGTYVSAATPRPCVVCRTTVAAVTVVDERQEVAAAAATAAVSSLVASLRTLDDGMLAIWYQAEGNEAPAAAAAAAAAAAMPCPCFASRVGRATVAAVVIADQHPEFAASAGAAVNPVVAS